MTPFLLHSTDQVIRLPLNLWADKLIRVSQRSDTTSDVVEHIEDIAINFNQASLVFASYGWLDIARETCLSSIKFYYALTDKYNDTRFLKYIIQPWINIGRLDRLTHNYSDAIDKFMLLSSLGYDEEVKEDSTMGMVCKAARLLEKTKGHLGNLIKSAPVIETIKTYLAAHNYEAIISSFPISKQRPAGFLMSMVTEAQAVSLFFLKDYDSADKILNKSCNSGLHISTQVFYVRLYQFYEKIGNFNLRGEAKKTLIGFMRSCDFNKEADVPLLTPAVEFCKNLLNSNFHEEGSELLIRCYEAYRNLNDEVGQLKSLELLIKYRSVNNGNYQNDFEKLMSSSGYEFIRSKNSSGLWLFEQALKDLLVEINKKFNLLVG